MWIGFRVICLIEKESESESASESVNKKKLNYGINKQ